MGDPELAAAHRELLQLLGGPSATTLGMAVLEATGLPAAVGSSLFVGARLEHRLRQAAGDVDTKLERFELCGEQLASLAPGRGRTGGRWPSQAAVAFTQAVPPPAEAQLSLKLEAQPPGGKRAAVGEVAVAFGGGLADGRPHDCWLVLRGSRAADDGELGLGWLRVLLWWL